MEPDEHFRHVQRGQLLKCMQHMWQARMALNKCHEHARLAETANEFAEVTRKNLDALLMGLNETMETAAAGAEHIRRAMTHPDARPLPLTATLGKFLTPFQRRLQHEGVNFDLPKHNPPKSWLTIPKILTFTIKTKRPARNRKKSKNNPPV